MRLFRYALCAMLFALLLPAQAGYDGFTLVAGKSATADGAVLVGHNQDNHNAPWVNVFKLPPQDLSKADAALTAKIKQSPPLGRTIPMLWLDLAGTDYDDSCFNEKGVVVASTACPSREDRSDLTAGGIGDTLSRLVAERARNAREAVRITGELIQQHGFAASGRAFVIADAGEVWILQAVRGRHWIAKRLPDDEVAVIANCYTVNGVNLADGDNFQGSADIAEYAEKRGWYNPEKDGAFDFARAYSDPDARQSAANTLRQWQGRCILMDKELRIDDPHPFSVRPRRKVKLQDFFRILRDHYEETDYDLSNNYKIGSPHATKNRTICNESTQYSFVAQLRGWLPAEMANLAWIAFRRPDSNAYVPWYFQLTEPPQGFGRTEAEPAAKSAPVPVAAAENSDEPFWNFAKLSELVDRQYRDRIDKVQKVWRNFENFIFKDLKNRETELEYILKNNRTVAINLITNYVHFLEYRKWLLAADLIRELRK